MALRSLGNNPGIQFYRTEQAAYDWLVAAGKNPKAIETVYQSSTEGSQHADCIPTRGKPSNAGLSSTAGKESGAKGDIGSLFVADAYCCIEVF